MGSASSGFEYGHDFDETATDYGAVQKLADTQQQRANQQFLDRVGGRESLAREQQRTALIGTQRQMGAAAAGSTNPLQNRQAMIGGTRMATDIAGQAGGARQQEIMQSRGQLVDVYGQQSARLLAMQEMENRRKMAALQAAMEKRRADLIEAQGEQALRGQILGGVTSAVGAMAGMGGSIGGGGGGGQAGAGGEAAGSSAYQRMGGGGGQYWTPQSYDINDYMDTYGTKEYDPYGSR